MEWRQGRQFDQAWLGFQSHSDQRVAKRVTFSIPGLALAALKTSAFRTGSRSRNGSIARRPSVALRPMQQAIQTTARWLVRRAGRSARWQNTLRSPHFIQRPTQGGQLLNEAFFPYGSNLGNHQLESGRNPDRGRSLLVIFCGGPRPR